MSNIIDEGRAAWARIKNRDKASFDDWVLIGRALIEARRQCMAQANVNSPFGPGYQKHMRAFLDANSMADLDSHERYGAVLIVEHLGEIEAYRAGLTEAERSRCCHVNTVLKHWRDGSAPQPQGPKAKPRFAEPDTRREVAKGRYDPPRCRPTQDMIRRVADRMRLSGKSDWYQLATVAIETLTVADLHDLMPKARPAQLAMELHA